MDYQTFTITAARLFSWPPGMQVIEINKEDHEFHGRRYAQNLPPPQITTFAVDALSDLSRRDLIAPEIFI